MQEFTLKDLPVTITTHSPEETEAVGAALARLMEGTPSLPAFIAMYGDLGVGKTAFVRGAGDRLGSRAWGPLSHLLSRQRVPCGGKKAPIPL